MESEAAGAHCTDGVLKPVSDVMRFQMVPPGGLTFLSPVWKETTSTDLLEGVVVLTGGPS